MQLHASLVTLQICVNKNRRSPLSQNLEEKK